MKTQAGRGPVGRVALFFQEQIQGPENASIARFDGFGRYQIRSEKAGIWSAGSFEKSNKKGPETAPGGAV